MHVGVYKNDWLVHAQVILDSLSQSVHFGAHALLLFIDFLEFGAEVRIDYVIVLLRLANVDALFKHRLQLCELFQGTVEGIYHFGPERMIFKSDLFIEVTHQTLQGMDHVVHFDAVDKLSVVSELGLYSIKLGVEFL